MNETKQERLPYAATIHHKEDDMNETNTTRPTVEAAHAVWKAAREDALAAWAAEQLASEAVKKAHAAAMRAETAHEDAEDAHEAAKVAALRARLSFKRAQEDALAAARTFDPTH